MMDLLGPIVPYCKPNFYTPYVCPGDFLLGWSVEGTGHQELDPERLKPHLVKSLNCLPQQAQRHSLWTPTAGGGESVQSKPHPLSSSLLSAFPILVTWAGSNLVSKTFFNGLRQVLHFMTEMGTGSSASMLPPWSQWQNPGNYWSEERKSYVTAKWMTAEHLWVLGSVFGTLKASSLI
jgi:hypothetical protein